MNRLLQRFVADSSAPQSTSGESKGKSTPDSFHSNDLNKQSQNGRINTPVQATPPEIPLSSTSAGVNYDTVDLSDNAPVPLSTQQMNASSVRAGYYDQYYHHQQPEHKGVQYQQYYDQQQHQQYYAQQESQYYDDTNQQHYQQYYASTSHNSNSSGTYTPNYAGTEYPTPVSADVLFASTPAMANPFSANPTDSVSTDLNQDANPFAQTNVTQPTVDLFTSMSHPPASRIEPLNHFSSPTQPVPSGTEFSPSVSDYFTISTDSDQRASFPTIEGEPTTCNLPTVSTEQSPTEQCSVDDLTNHFSTSMSLTVDGVSSIVHPPPSQTTNGIFPSVVDVSTSTVPRSTTATDDLMQLVEKYRLMTERLENEKKELLQVLTDQTDHFYQMQEYISSLEREVAEYRAKDPLHE